MKKLYSLVHTKDKEKKGLYIKGTYSFIENGILQMKDGDVANFTTYFNSFSVKKWKRYTTIKKVILEMYGEGDFVIVFEQLLSSGNVIKIPAVMKNGEFSYAFDIEKISGDILGFSIKCLSAEGFIFSAAWYGEFEQWSDKKIGVSITTFKREKYVKKTIAVLQEFQKEHEWLDILVVDNGKTLPPEKKEHFQIIPNRNFGGSGGFTRGMIEYVEQGNVDYVLLMDDDIVLEPSAIERTQSILCGLKETFKDSFLSGAMLRMENPVIQHENTAYWNRIISVVCHKGLNLSVPDSLVKNEKLSIHASAYAGWWYCCIPMYRIKHIGYPLPLFIKSDDMEYGIRNHREIIHMNGIGVWHEIFNKKMSLAIRFYSDRNSFILNHYAPNCNRVTLILAILFRILKRIIHRDRQSIYVLLLALEDYNSGIVEILKKTSDRKMSDLLSLLQQPVPENLLSLLWQEIGKAIREYPLRNNSFLQFRKEKLQSSAFWKAYLKRWGT